jgi:hypothetical protein
MSTRITQASIIEVPLPQDGGDGVCMPMVVMQPTADASDYMLKPNYATNGQPGVVDHAVLANTALLANQVAWSGITGAPATFPPSPHAPSHLTSGNDAIPIATTLMEGLLRRGTGNSGDYMGGDLAWHPQNTVGMLRSEEDATIDPAFTAGAEICSGIVSNPSFGAYFLDFCYLFAANPNYPIAGFVHFDIFDPSIPGWVQVTESTDLSFLAASPINLVRPEMLSVAMTRCFTAQPNSLQWRLMLDQSSGVPGYLRVGTSFFLTLLMAPLTPAPAGQVGVAIKKGTQ